MTERPLRLLLVDDEASLRKPLGRYLREQQGYVVDEAVSVKQAMGQVETSSESFDVALIDDMLLRSEQYDEPEPLGIELMKAIRDRSPATEFILFTGWGMESGLEAMRQGAYRYIRKPFDLDELAFMIEHAAEYRLLKEAVRAQQSQIELRLQEALTLQKIAASLAGTLELNDLLNQVMKAAMELTESDSGNILFWNDAEQQFTDALSTVEPDGVLQPYEASPRKTGIATRIASNREFIEISDSSEHQSVNAVKVSMKPRAMIGLPLICYDEVIGVLDVSSSEPRQFSDRQKNLLQSLADFAAIAIERARKYEELKETKGLVGARTALAWMGMASSAWRHAVTSYAITIRDQSALLQRDINRDADHSSISRRVEMIGRLSNAILEKPITLPLSNEESLDSVSINALISERIRQLWQNDPYSTVSLKTDFQLQESATVRASSEWLRRAFDVLVDNAVNAVAGNQERQVTVTTQMHRGGAEVTIIDTGSGISEDLRELIGKEWIEKPSEARGLGMGLLMAETIVQAYGGRIFVKSTGPDGTAMVMWLPLEEHGDIRGET